MVVMKYLAFQEGIGGLVRFENRLNNMEGAVRREVEVIIDYLQAQRTLHADPRPNNIMVRVDI